VKDEADTPSRLVVLGVSEARQTHLFEHSTDALAQFLAEAEIGTHACDPRVSSEAGECGRVRQVDNPGEASRALELDPIVEDSDSDVIPRDRVRPVNDCVDEPFHPCVLGHDSDSTESPVSTERLAHRQLLLDHPTGLGQLVRDRALDSNVCKKLLSSARLGRTSTVPDHTNMGVRQFRLRG